MRKLTIDTKTYKGIPYCEYYLENSSPRGLVFVQHGFQSNKEYGADYLALTLARDGFKVVSIDAYKHGERIEEPYISQEEYKRHAEVFRIVDRTTSDIVLLYEELYKNSFASFDLIGVSMGGFIAYLVAQRTEHINKLVPTISTPMFLKLAKTREDIINLEEYAKQVESELEFIESIDPYLNKNSLKYNQILIINGDKDPNIPVQDSIQFFHEQCDSNARLEIFDEFHEVNREMQKAIFKFINNEKVVL